MKFCIDCKHYMKRNGQEYCAKTERVVTLVTGEMTYAKCERERQEGGSCGKEGKNWEAK